MNGPRWSDYLYIAATIGLTVYGQMVLKWRMDQAGPLPAGWIGGLRHLLVMLLDPFVLSTFAAAFLASLAWMAAMTRFPLSVAYPFMSLNFAIVLFLGVTMLGESLTLQKAAGVALIVLGTALVSADKT